MITLRPYQMEMVAGLREKMKSSKSVLAQLSTGGGKTALASYMVKGAVQKQKTVFFTVHRKDLLDQTALAFREFDIPYSYIAAGRTYNPYATAQICSIDTLKNRLGKTPVPDLMIVDEVHMANSEGWSKVINFYRQLGAYVIGLSATPWRLDGSGLGRHFEQMICGPNMNWLIENKFLSDFRLFAPSHPDLGGVKITAGDYNRGELAAWADGDSVIVGSAIEHYKRLAPGSRAIAYCVSRKHSERVAKDFCAAGIPAKHMDGETPMEERRKIITDYASGKISVLTNVDLITTGFDLASQVGREVAVETIVLLRPTRSTSLYLQMVGRGLRYKTNPAIILDHVNAAQEHGLPDMERTWTLDDRPKRKSGEKSIPIKQCPPPHGCYFVYRGHLSACPNCGYAPPIQYRTVKEVEGELAEIKRGEQLQAEKIRKNKRREVGMARSMAELSRIAAERGYGPGWVYRTARAKGIRS